MVYGPSSGAGKQLLNLVLGQWVDSNKRDESRYQVTLDDGGHTCSVRTTRSTGEVIDSKGLIRLSDQRGRASCIHWGANFSLDIANATESHITWLRVDSDRNFVWRRPGAGREQLNTATASSRPQRACRDSHVLSQARTVAPAVTAPRANVPPMPKSPATGKEVLARSSPSEPSCARSRAEAGPRTEASLTPTLAPWANFPPLPKSTTTSSSVASNASADRSTKAACSEAGLASRGPPPPPRESASVPRTPPPNHSPQLDDEKGSGHVAEAKLEQSSIASSTSSTCVPGSPATMEEDPALVVLADATTEGCATPRCLRPDRDEAVVENSAIPLVVELAECFQYGDRVEAQCPGWGPDWHPAIVRQLLQDDIIEVLWDGDPSISHVPQVHVRRAFQIGDRVSACWGPDSYPAEVRRLLPDRNVELRWVEDHTVSVLHITQVWLRLEALPEEQREVLCIGEMPLAAEGSLPCESPEPQSPCARAEHSSAVAVAAGDSVDTVMAELGDPTTAQSETGDLVCEAVEATNCSALNSDGGNERSIELATPNAEADMSEMICAVAESFQSEEGVESLSGDTPSAALELATAAAKIAGKIEDESSGEVLAKQFDAEGKDRMSSATQAESREPLLARQLEAKEGKLRKDLGTESAQEHESGSSDESASIGRRRRQRNIQRSGPQIRQVASRKTRRRKALAAKSNESEERAEAVKAECAEATKQGEGGEEEQETCMLCDQPALSNKISSEGAKLGICRFHLRRFNNMETRLNKWAMQAHGDSNALYALASERAGEWCAEQLSDLETVKLLVEYLIDHGQDPAIDGEYGGPPVEEALFTWLKSIRRVEALKKQKSFQVKVATQEELGRRNVAMVLIHRWTSDGKGNDEAFTNPKAAKMVKKLKKRAEKAIHKGGYSSGEDSVISWEDLDS